MTSQPAGPARAADAVATPRDTVTSIDGTAVVAPGELRRRARAWMLYDVGNSAFQSVVVTFVFATYLASNLFLDPAVAALGAADPSAPEYLAAQAGSQAVIANLDTIAALIVAVLAPALGARTDGTGSRKRLLIVFSLVTIACMFAMFFVLPGQSFLFFGAALLAIGVVFSELAGVSYDAMLAQVATKQSVGRVSGLGWGLGYIGSIVLLFALLLLFIQGFGVDGRAGVLGVPSGADADALNIRLAVVASALWFAAFLVPIALRVPESRRVASRARTPWYKTYGVLWSTIRSLARRDPKLLLFLVASAIYRDGLATVFGFGAILAVQVYGFTSGGVIYFAVAANLVAGIGTIAAGWIDDRVSPKAVIVASLGALVAAAVVLFVLPNEQALFWILGLALCLFVGPVQSASRSYLLRATPTGHEGEIFGLYRTTGRAGSWITTALIALFAVVSGDPELAIVAIGLVLLVGLALVVPVPTHPRQIELGSGEADADAAHDAAPVRAGDEPGE